MVRAGTAMKNRTLVLGALAVLAAAAGFAVTRGGVWLPQGAVAQAPGGGPRPVSVEVAKAEKKAVPLRVEALGTVTPIASVAIKARLETVITEVHFRDGAEVRQGDLLFTLDSRQIEAEIKRVEAVIAGALAQLDREAAEIDRALEADRIRREGALPTVDGRLLRLYDRLRRAQRFPALVPLRGQACGSCHNRMPPQVVQEIRHSGSLHVCEACGVLVYAESEAPAEARSGA